MNRLQILFILVCLFSCDTQEQDPPYVQMVQKIEKQVINELRNNENLLAIGIGGGMIGSINRLSLMFQYYDEVDIDTARKLVIIAATTYINALNDNKEVRPYLRYYPFRIEDIGIKIFFKNNEHYPVAVGEIEAGSLVAGKITYYEKIEERFSVKSIKKEPFAEAYQIVKGVPYNPPPSKLQPVIKDDPI